LVPSHAITKGNSSYGLLDGSRTHSDALGARAFGAWSASGGVGGMAGAVAGGAAGRLPPAACRLRQETVNEGVPRRVDEPGIGVEWRERITRM
jgi:hypothetical protein